MIKNIFALTLLLFCFSSFAATKIFNREYSYKASDDDSKISSRLKAVEQVKVSLLNEIGTYIESYLELNEQEVNGQATDFVKSEIKTITAGITKFKILSEEWDGQNYKLQTEVEIDVDDVVKRINQVLEERKSSKEVIRLKNILSERDTIISSKTAELKELSLRLVAKQQDITSLISNIDNKNTSINRQQSKIDALELELDRLNGILQRKDEKERQVLDELDRIKIKIENETSEAKAKVVVGMTPEEVVKILGKPRSRDDCSDCLFYNYGRIWIWFQSGSLKGTIPINQYRGACNCINL